VSKNWPGRHAELGMEGSSGEGWTSVGDGLFWRELVKGG